MDQLQKIFDVSFQESLSFKKVGAKLIARKLEKLGIVLNQPHLDKLEVKLEDLEGDSLTIQIDDLDIQNEQLENLQIDLDNPDDLDEIVNEVIEGIVESVPDIISEISNVLLDQLKYSKVAMLEEHKQEREEFETNIEQAWGVALDLLEMLLVIAYEAGEDFNEEFRPKAAEEQNFVFEVLTRLHARACQVGSEILTLLRAGFADGAHARWRTLHEITVIAAFIQQHGNEVAERYLLHEHIESYKAARQYQNYYSRLGDEPIPDQELADLQSMYQQLINQFGPSYRNNYGWAAVVTRNQDPNFSDIEQAVGFDHWRPYYKLASHNVHANSKGVLFRLGLYPESTNYLLAGPSSAGLADPGHGTAISLAQITAMLLTTEANIDRLVLCQVLIDLENEIGDVFLAADKQSK